MAPSERHELLIIEKQYGGTQHLWKLTDEGEVVAANASPGVSRQHKANSGLKQLLASAFLPVGYPHSVTPDYAGGSVACCRLGWLCSDGMVISETPWV